MNHLAYVHQRTEAEKKARQRKIIKRNIIGTAMASPPFIGFLCFSLFPMLVSLYISFHELHSYNMSYAVFVGFDNFVDVFKDPMLYKSIGNTLYYCISVPINLCFQVFLAHTLSKKLAGGKIAKIIMFMPQVCSGVAVTLMWQWIFEGNYGVINTFLHAIGLPKIGFMYDKNWFMPAVLIISLWTHGTNIVLLESAFVNVNKSLQEAARIDGANERQVFWKITLPALTPTIFYIFTMNLITALQEQTTMQIITTNGVGPDHRALTLVYYVYRMAFTHTTTMGMGMSCALSWYVAIVILIITRINFWASRFWVNYD